MQRTSELGVPVTTDPGVIAAFVRRRGRRVVFATYQSSPQIAAAFRAKTTPQFDFAIADEAHRCAGRASNEFATILDGGKIRSKRRLFMTATPRFYTPRLRKEAGLLDVEIASMDDESVFGPVLHRLTFGEAIERDLLSDYQVVVVGVDNATYRAWAERGEFVSPDGEKVTDARTPGWADRSREGDAQVQPPPRHLLPRPCQRCTQVQRGRAVCERVDARPH